MPKVVGIGETVLDMVFIDGQPKAAVPGGSVFNSLVSLGRTIGDKVEVVMISQVGDDQVAGIMFDFMKRNRINSNHIKKEQHKQSTVSMAMLDSKGDAKYEFFRDRSMPPFQAPDLDFEPGDMVLFGSFFAVDDATREQTRKLIRKARSQGAMVYYDINYRKNHLMDLPRLKAEIEQNCRLASIVRGSSEDIACVYGIEDASQAYETKMRQLCPHFIYTRGSEPTEVFWDGRRSEYEVAPVRVVSTIGAGDNFNAGFIHGLVSGGTVTPSEADLELCVATGLKFSAAVCASLDNYVPEQ